MKFLKVKSSYVVIESKEEALQLIKQDGRVKEAKINKKGELIIITHPIKPICKNRTYKKIIIYPIGTYIITLKLRYDNIGVEIKRVNGGTGKRKRDIHPHINLEGNGSGICWGNIQDEIDKIRENKDWLWLTKRVLDILEDGEPEVDSDGDLHMRGMFVRIMIELQVKYLRKKYGDSQRNKNRMKKLYKFYDKFYNALED